MTEIRFYARITDFIQQRTAEFGQIEETRKPLLLELANYIRQCKTKEQMVQLTFLCTHNSRRSHFSQIWAKVAADYYQIGALKTFSGGTEATAMNERVVESLRRIGMDIQVDGGSTSNPNYLIHYAENQESLICFSKVYDSDPNPSRNFAAIMTCSSADRACPVVPGCDARLPIRYEDPKVSDGTDREHATYDERSRQICREMLFAMSQVTNH